MTPRLVRRAFQHVRALRFLRRLETANLKPGAYTVLPDDVRMDDVVFWMNRRLLGEFPFRFASNDAMRVAAQIPWWHGTERWIVK